jgi:hypothetical protein
LDAYGGNWSSDYLVILKLGFLITLTFPSCLGIYGQHKLMFLWILLMYTVFIWSLPVTNRYFNLVFQIEAPVHSSNVMLYSKEQNVASRVGHKILEDGNRVRYLIKTGEIIDTAENWKRLKEEKTKTEVAAAS